MKQFTNHFALAFRMWQTHGFRPRRGILSLSPPTFSNQSPSTQSWSPSPSFVDDLLPISGRHIRDLSNTETCVCDVCFAKCLVSTLPGPSKRNLPFTLGRATAMLPANHRLDTRLLK